MTSFRVALLTMVCALSLAPAVTADEEVVQGSPRSVEELTERVRKSVAVITSPSRDGRRDALGSGFVISPEGLIATNYHVIGEGRGVRVQLADGRQFEATAVHAFDRQLDLALVKIDAKDLQPLALGDSDAVKQGQSVLALGSPLGFKNSVVAGLVSSVREIDGRKMIQLAIPIEPGNSGGPLVDMQGNVLGILTMKSLVTPNLGFAVTINSLRPLVARPNPIPMSRWLTIGALDPHQWKPFLGARWRQRAGRITVEGAGQGFGGRSLCLSQLPVPPGPLELAVAVQLNDESGAAGLAFCSDGNDRHYGFYPSGGRLRLTRFDGPDVTSWTILHDESAASYVAGGWNTLRVRLEDGKIRAFVNDRKVVELAEHALASGQVGLVKFRETKAQFKNFRLGSDLPATAVPLEAAQRITKLLDAVGGEGSFDRQLIEALASDADHAAALARDRAAALDRQAKRLRELADAAHAHRVIADLNQVLAQPEQRIDLVRAGLLVARLDNDEVDVDSYCDEVDRMGRELAGRLAPVMSESAKLETLRKYLFEENGFHGSRGDYYNRANSYLNEVLDDREGLPITLSVVYMELARRIGLNVVGLSLPGHFVVQHLGADGASQVIDVYDAAKVLSRDEVAQRVKEATDRDLTDDDFTPSTKRAIITRMLHNLLNVSDTDPKSLHRYLNAILSIEPASARHRWLRAVVRYRLQERTGALEDVEWLLSHKPEGIDIGQVIELQRALEAQR
jgi:S1-C subfamily serine protease/regulator of sirC expression with transglutaminase-like and TPR domain